MRGALYLVFLSLLAAGMLAGRYLPPAALVVGAPALAGAVLALCIVLPGNRRRFLALPASFASLGLILMVLTFAGARHGVLPRLASGGEVVTISGTVASPPVEGAGETCFFVSVGGVSASGRRWRTREKVMARLEGVAGAMEEAYPGREIDVTGPIACTPKDPGWLLEHGAFSAISARGGGSVEWRGSGAVPAAISGARGWISRSYRRLFEQPVEGFLEGVTLSSLARMEAGVIEDLRGCGLSHVVAVSGLHVGAAAALALLLLGALQAGRRTRYSLACLMALAVLALANFRPSATRAAIMACICFSGTLLGRRYDSLAGLSIAGILILCLNPLALFDMGFQLSFAAALGIVLAVRSGERRRFRLVLAVCCGAQLGILPVLLLRGEGLPVTAIAANMIAVPLVGPILFTSWAAAAMGSVSAGLAGVVAIAPSAMARVVLGTASVMSRVPMAGLGTGTLAIAALALYVAGLVSVITGFRKARSLFRPFSMVVLAVLLSLMAFLPPAVLEGGDRILVMDVGEGDAVLVRDGLGGSILVDGGPDDALVARKLQSLGVARIDLVIASHAHQDHLGGLPAVLREVAVGRLLLPGPPGEESRSYRELIEAAGERGVPKTIARERQVFEVSPELRLEVLYAPADLEDKPENPNNCSIVCMVELGGASALFPGDLERDGQSVLLGLHPDLSCDFLKVPHQGAGNSATRELVESCDPAIAAISVEEGNRYGHPSPRCTELLRERGVEVFRTDRDGDIEVTIDNGRIGVATNGR